jgi:hypothetical protein
MRNFFRESPFHWEVFIFLCFIILFALGINACSGSLEYSSQLTSSKETVEAIPETLILVDYRRFIIRNRVQFILIVICDTARDNLIYVTQYGDGPGVHVIQGGCKKNTPELTDAFQP